MSGQRETQQQTRKNGFYTVVQLAATGIAFVLLSAGLLTACRNEMADGFWAGYAAQADNVALAGLWTCRSDSGTISLLKLAEDGRLTRWEQPPDGAESYGTGHWQQQGNDIRLRMAGYDCLAPDMAESVDGFAFCRPHPVQSIPMHILHRVNGIMAVQNGTCYRATASAADAMETVLQSAAAQGTPFTAEGADQARHSQPRRLQILIAALSENRIQATQSQQPRYDDMIRTSHITLRKIQRLLRL